MAKKPSSSLAVIWVLVVGEWTTSKADNRVVRHVWLYAVYGNMIGSLSVTPGPRSPL